MSELKAYIAPNADGTGLADYYLKSEADKVIANNKYKRCLAMARWCEATALWCYQAANTLPAGFHATLYGKPVMMEPTRLFKRHVLLTLWSARWLELAKKFKPNN